MDRGIGNISNTPEGGCGAFVGGYRGEKIRFQYVGTREFSENISVEFIWV
jgi:hypothetical protein